MKIEHLILFSEFALKVVLSLVFLLINLIVIDPYLKSKLNFYLLLVISGFLIKKVWTNIVFIVFFLFLISYVQPFYPYLFHNREISYHTSYSTIEYLGKTLQILTLFFLSIIISLKSIKTKEINFELELNNYFYTLFCICSLLFIHFFLKGESLLSGSYGSIEKQHSPLYEYTLLFLTPIAIGAQKSKFKVYIFYFLVFLISVKSVLYGGRITAIQAIFLSFIVFQSKKIRKGLILSFLVLGIFIMRIFTFIRNNIAEIALGEKSVLDMFYTGADATKPLATNQGDIAQASARVLGLLHDNLLTTEERIASFVQNILSIFTPGYKMSELVDLSLFMKDSYESGGGILFPVSFYVWFGYLGVILSGLFVAWIVNVLNYSNNIYLKVYGLVVLITSFRWFGYASFNPFKMCIYVLPLIMMGMYYISLKPLSKTT